MFILSFINGRPMVAGRDTAADGIIRMAGAVNVFGEFEGYKIVNDEAVVAAAPEAVLGMQRAGLDLDGAGRVRACGFPRNAGRPQASASSRWKAFTCWASGRAPRAPRAI